MSFGILRLKALRLMLKARRRPFWFSRFSLSVFFRGALLSSGSDRKRGRWGVSRRRTRNWPETCRWGHRWRRQRRVSTMNWSLAQFLSLIELILLLEHHLSTAACSSLLVLSNRKQRCPLTKRFNSSQSPVFPKLYFLFCVVSKDSWTQQRTYWY